MCVYYLVVLLYISCSITYTLEWLVRIFFHFCIDTTNNILASEVAGLNSPTGARLQCTFLSGFTGSAHCIVQYGTDPTYMNLPYSAESTRMNTAGDSVSVVLRERLNSTTVYYYTVSAVSGDISLIVRGTFTTPQYSKYVNWLMVHILYIFSCMLCTWKGTETYLLEL